MLCDLPLPNSKLSVFTIPYVNTEEESVEVDDNLTDGFVSEITKHDFANSTDVNAQVAVISNSQ